MNDRPPLVIPSDIGSLSRWEQVQLFHSHGDIVIPLHPSAVKKVNTPIKKIKSRLDDHELYLHFGNGANINIGVIPKKGEIIIDLDGRELEDVRRFLNSTPALDKVPRVKTDRGYHLRFKCEDLPSSIGVSGFYLQKDIRPGVDFELFTGPKYVVIPPSFHKSGVQYQWDVCGEVPAWKWADIAAVFNLTTPPEEEDDTTTTPARVLTLRPGDVGYKPRLEFAPGFSFFTARTAFEELNKLDIFYQQGGKLVMYDKESKNSIRLVPVSPDRFRTISDKYFDVRKDTRARPICNGGEHTTMTREDAAMLLESTELQRILKPIARVIQHPILTPDGEIVTTGEHDGVFVDSRCGDIPADVPLEEATASILSLFRDFKFNTRSDLSRAISHLISPAMVFGDLLSGSRVPFHVVQADQPGSGKGYLQKIVLAVYGELPGIITNIRSGVGGIDEILSKRLLDGSAFIQYDNWRGKLSSEMLESALTEDLASCRTLHQSATVSTKGAFFMLTSNGAELTADLADRSCFVRIVKQEEGYQWSTYEGEDLDVHLKHNREYYLGCIYSVLREWLKKGKPRNKGNHRFHQWAGAMDWVVQTLFALPPLMDGHKQILKEVASDILVFLRQAAFPIRDEGLLGEGLQTSDLVQLATRHDLTMRGMSMNGEDAPKKLGIKLSPCFKHSATLTLDNSFTVVRDARRIKRADRNGYFEVPTYSFYTTATPTPTTAASNYGVSVGDGKVDVESEKVAVVGPETPDHSHYHSYSAATQEMPSGCGPQMPQYQVVVTQKTPLPQPLQPLSLSIVTRDKNDNSENENGLVGKIKGESGCGGCGQKTTPPGIRMVRDRSGLSSLASTLAGIPSHITLSVDLEMSKYADVIWLMSIQAPGYGSWLIEVQKVGSHEAITSELGEILESHPINRQYVPVSGFLIPAAECVKVNSEMVTVDGHRKVQCTPSINGEKYYCTNEPGKDPLEVYLGIKISPWFSPRGKQPWEPGYVEPWVPKSAIGLYKEIRAEGESDE